MIGQLFNAILFQPLLNALVLIYNFVPGHDLGIAIVILTLIIRLILYPLASQSIKSQKALQELQPKMDALKKMYKDDREKLAKETMELYKSEKVNPLSSCLPLLIQLPFLIAVYRVFSSGLHSDSLNLLYPFVQNPGQLNPISLGFFDLSKPNVILAALTGLAQFWQTKMLSTKRPPKVPGAKDEDMMTIMNQQMLYFMPIMTFVLGITWPSGLILYWLLTTLVTVAQQELIFKKRLKKPTVEVIDAPK